MRLSGLSVHAGPFGTVASVCPFWIPVDVWRCRFRRRVSFRINRHQFTQQSSQVYFRVSCLRRTRVGVHDTRAHASRKVQDQLARCLLAPAAALTSGPFHFGDGRRGHSREVVCRDACENAALSITGRPAPEPSPIPRLAFRVATPSGSRSQAPLSGEAPRPPRRRSCSLARGY